MLKIMLLYVSSISERFPVRYPIKGVVPSARDILLVRHHDGRQTHEVRINVDHNQRLRAENGNEKAQKGLCYTTRERIQSDHRFDPGFLKWPLDYDVVAELE